jgi:choline kinase
MNRPESRPGMAGDAPQNRIIILGAGRALRLDLPPALVAVDRHGRVMDWLLSAFSVLPGTVVHFISGYKASEIRQRYPGVDLIHNPDWETTGPSASLALAPLQSAGSTYVTYSDVVFRPRTVELLDAAAADLVIAVDSRWRVRYDGRSRSEMDQAEKVLLDGDRLADIGRRISTTEAQAEFVGLFRVSGNAVWKLQDALGAGVFDPRAGLPQLIQFLLENGLSARVVDVAGDWAELNAPQDLSRFVLGTKAESLNRLKPLLKKGRIGDICAFAHREWLEDREGVLSRVREILGTARLIVRSSALSEDQWHQSAAGAFESVPNVDGASREDVANAVDTVLASYSGHHPDDQVLVQEMIADIDISGVVMTRTPTQGSPYRVISFDDTTQRTDTVTAGTSEFRTVFVHRGQPLRADFPERLHQLAEVVDELEELVGHDSLDIEFACTRDGTAHVLQVRPIVLPQIGSSIDDHAIDRALVDAQRFFRELERPAPFVVGDRTQLSVMSDWNPAEIIGTKPKRLAFSLYRYLITDEVWARQRAEYGYRDVRPCNLIVDLLGHPYIDVRATFNSFVPATLPEDAAKRLVNHYLDLLTASPELHDKVEFKVLFTCLSFDLETRARERLGDVLSEEEFRQFHQGLLEITRAGMERCADDFASIGLLEQRFERIQASDLPPLERAYVLLEDLRKYGTPLFSHLARAGFVAATMLRSLPSTGILPTSAEADFMATVDTISGKLAQDARRVHEGRSSFDDFVTHYGHLRPGTYDITSPHYASAPDLFLRPIVRNAGLEPAEDPPPHPWNDDVRSAISRELERIGLDPDVSGFETFLRQAIEGRELAKFVFTRNLSASLESIARFAAEHDVGREELAHVRIEDLWKLRSARPRTVASDLRALARQGMEAFRLTEAICLPGQIFSETDIVCFEQLKATPNFVTGKTVMAPILCLSANSSPEVEVEGKIVVIPNADPGFDWLFSRSLVGLITMYGGGNSHMAIRAAEFGLPAAIGVGELLFEKLAQADVIELNCGSQQIRMVDQ